jgi:hypothetical protein
MQRLRPWTAITATRAVMAAAGAPFAAAVALAERPAAGPAHTFLHMGCKRHNHGPKWHDDQARILGHGDAGTATGASRPAFSATGLANRSFVTGHPVDRARTAPPGGDRP